MKEQFLAVFGNWINQYKTDIKSKVEKFLTENESNPEELADVIDVPVEDIYDILDGNGENISVETFGKLLLASGFALRIEPIEQTPLGSYDNVDPMVMRRPHCEHMHRHTPRQNPFMRQRDMVDDFDMPPCDFDPSRIPPHIREKIERDFGMNGEQPIRRHEPSPRFTQERHRPMERHTSPFATMNRDELVRIIRNKLWDSEIDVLNASDRELVRFLEEKDKRMQQVIRRERGNEELERDPQVANFIKEMRKNIKENPQLRSYMNKFMNGLDEE